MIKVKQITSNYRSIYAASKALKINATQLKRWVDMGAMVDEKGNVWIETKGTVSASEK